MKNVLLTIKSIQKTGNDISPLETDESFELTVPGTIDFTENNIIIEYDEVDQLSRDSNKALLLHSKISACKNDSTVIISRDKTFIHDLELKKDTTCATVYATPFGNIHITVFTDNVSINIYDKSGNIKADYTLVFDSGQELQNIIDISYKTIGEKNDY